MKKVISILMLSAALFTINTQAMEHEASAAVAVLATAHPILTKKADWPWGKIATGAAVVGGIGTMYKAYTWYSDLKKQNEDLKKQLAALQTGVSTFGEKLGKVEVNGSIELPEELEDLPEQIEKMGRTLGSLVSQQSETSRKLETLVRSKRLDAQSRARYAKKHGMGDLSVVNTHGVPLMVSDADQDLRSPIVTERHIVPAQAIKITLTPAQSESQEKDLKERAVAAHAAMPAPAGDPEIPFGSD